jgi:hypothetical protein
MLYVYAGAIVPPSGSFVVCGKKLKTSHNDQARKFLSAKRNRTTMAATGDTATPT